MTEAKKSNPVDQAFFQPTTKLAVEKDSVNDRVLNREERRSFIKAISKRGGVTFKRADERININCIGNDVTINFKGNAEIFPAKDSEYLSQVYFKLKELLKDGFERV